MNEVSLYQVTLFLRDDNHDIIGPRVISLQYKSANQDSTDPSHASPGPLTDRLGLTLLWRSKQCGPLVDKRVQLVIMGLVIIRQ